MLSMKFGMLFPGIGELILLPFGSQIITYLMKKHTSNVLHMVHNSKYIGKIMCNKTEGKQLGAYDLFVTEVKYYKQWHACHLGHIYQS